MLKADRRDEFMTLNTTSETMKAASLGLFLALAAPLCCWGQIDLDDWETYSPRNEMRPEFAKVDASSGSTAALKISSAENEAIDGAWVGYFPVVGDSYYSFSIERKTERVSAPWRSAVVKITWLDRNRKNVHRGDELARPEYPLDQSRSNDGWTEVADTYHVPQEAQLAKVELHLRWSAGTVLWRTPRLEKVTAPGPRTVRLAAVHFQPKGGDSNLEKCELFAPLIEQAAKRDADVICLPESLTYYGRGLSMEECAEPIPGPSTEYFARLAKQHDLYIVAGLTERFEQAIYNTAILVGPNGELVGKYRKVCLPREEIESGVTPGSEYPVFETRFGTLGMMICWDVHFPEVARNLSIAGAEVIAMPIWGGNPILAQARAIENQIYLVSSTYTPVDRESMRSGVWGHRGEMLVQNGEQWGEVLVAEVDLNHRTHWEWLGDFKARIARERPIR